MSKSLVIHHNNVVDIAAFDAQIIFDLNGKIDTYIHAKMIPMIKNNEPDIIFIKDNLSSNYLELYGITLAYHIRLSKELGGRRFVPIVILSDVDACVLNKLDSSANILFTQNMYVIKNRTEQIEHFLNKEQAYTKKMDEKLFLSKITVEPPKETSHDIANEWAIYRWATLLNVENTTIFKNEDIIKSMLYFKYLLVNNPVDEGKSSDYKGPTEQGKVLYIDDEWDKGWKAIFDVYFCDTGIEFETFEKDFKNVESTSLLKEIREKIESSEPDVVLLDLRLLNVDKNREDIEEYTGIQIRNAIKDINPGIQVIMFTATSKSLILDKLYEYSILGYIKKEHPTDKNTDTIENMAKLAKLIDAGMQRKYLKQIWTVHNQILEKLEKDPFRQYVPKLKNYNDHLSHLKKEVAYVFEVLDSDMTNNFNYAVVSMARSLEVLVEIFFIDNGEYFWDNEKVKNYSSIKYKILSLIEQKLNYEDISGFEDNLEKMRLHRNAYMHSKKSYSPISSIELCTWFTLFEEIIYKVANPIPKSQEQIKEDEERKKRKENREPINISERMAKLKESKNKTK